MTSTLIGRSVLTVRALGAMLSREGQGGIAVRPLILFLMVLLVACQTAQRTETPPATSTNPPASSGGATSGATGAGGMGTGGY